MTPLERLLLPENLVFAWRKVQKIYASADGYFDFAELAAFEINLERELVAIRAQFERGDYKTTSLRPLLRPKKLESDRATNRQYFHVSVRDQVAWIAVVNALGPELDQKTPTWLIGPHEVVQVQG